MSVVSQGWVSAKSGGGDEPKSGRRQIWEVSSTSKKPKKASTSKPTIKKENPKKREQNRFEIHGGLLEDMEVSVETQTDWSALGRASPDCLETPEDEEAE